MKIKNIWVATTETISRSCGSKFTWFPLRSNPPEAGCAKERRRKALGGTYDWVNLPTPDQVNWSFPVRFPLGRLVGFFYHPIGRQKQNHLYATYSPCQLGDYILPIPLIQLKKVGGTVNGRNPAPVEVGSLSHYLHGFIHLNWCGISEPSTVGSIFHHPIGKDYKWHISGFCYCQLGDYMLPLPLIKGTRNSYW